MQAAGRIFDMLITAGLCLACWQILVGAVPVESWLGQDHLFFMVRLIAVFLLLGIAEKVVNLLRSSGPKH